MTEFFIGAALALAAVAFGITRSAKLKAAAHDWFADQLVRMGLIKPEPVKIVEPEPPPPPEPEPEPAVEIAPPDYGNIRPVLGEERDPDLSDEEIHEFPEMGQASTRFEDFNRRLFILSTAGKGNAGEWTKTTADDFATHLTGFSLSRLTEEVHRRLRPRYPVILDSYGYWAAASRALEMDPDYSDEIVDTYLAIPENERPVVVSIAAVNKDGVFTLMRYGFESFPLRVGAMQPYVKAGLELAMAALRGPSDDWLWFSIARLRHHVVRAAQADERKRLELEGAHYLENQTEQARRDAEHRNRFVALWKNRIDQQALALLPDETAVEPNPAQGGASS